MFYSTLRIIRLVWTDGRTITDLVQTNASSKLILVHTEGLNVISGSRNQASLAHQGWQGVGWPYLSPDLNPTQRRDLEFGFMDVQLTHLQ